MTPQQAKILRAYGGWVLADLALDTDSAISRTINSFWGCSDYAGQDWWMQTTSKGIEVRERTLSGPALDTVTWPMVRRWAKALPADLLEDLRAARAAISKHMATHRIHPNGTHLRDHLPRMGPLTLKQIAYIEACEQWEQWRAGYDADRRELEAVRERALDGLFDTEPVDLLDLLALEATA